MLVLVLVLLCKDIVDYSLLVLYWYLLGWAGLAGAAGGGRT